MVFRCRCREAGDHKRFQVGYNVNKDSSRLQLSFIHTSTCDRIVLIVIVDRVIDGRQSPGHFDVPYHT